jgi:hypothetical protein
LETLIFGAKILCKSAMMLGSAGGAQGNQGLDDAKEAIEILGKAKERMKFAAEATDEEGEAESQRLRAEFALAEGIADGVLAIKGSFIHLPP